MSKKKTASSETLPPLAALFVQFCAVCDKNSRFEVRTLSDLENLARSLMLRVEQSKARGEFTDHADERAIGVCDSCVKKSGRDWNKPPGRPA